MSKHHKPKKYFVHRLVAETFISNLEDKPQVNHIDGNPQNNNSNNLEWVTNAENTQHAYDTKLNKKKQLAINFNGDVKSLRKWCIELNLDYKKVWWRVHNGWSIERALNHIN